MEISKNLFNGVDKALPTDNYSLETKALIITGVAISAIGITSLALGISLATMSASVFCVFPIVFSVPIFFGGLGLVGFSIGFKHTNEVAQRYFNFAESQKDSKIKLEYYSKAADCRHVMAIQKEYNIGKNLIFNCCIEGDFYEKQFNKGLKIVNSAMKHSASYQNVVVERYLSLHPELTTQLKEEIINSKRNNTTIENIVNRYFNNIMRSFSSYQIHWHPAKF
ncbi:MAG: hypothetical protein H0W50_09115 [Parachlamydiaceae bacterium]|nr:hypothetical protein [Parachlamydiaceae bacterium]